MFLTEKQEVKNCIPLRFLTILNLQLGYKMRYTKR